VSLPENQYANTRLIELDLINTALDSIDDSIDKATNPSIQDRLADLDLFLTFEYEVHLAEVVELTNNPDAKFPFTGVSDWREAYLEEVKRSVRQLHEARFYLAAITARLNLAGRTTDRAVPARKRRKELS